MTWAIAACNMLGAYAAIVSDVQVTFGNKRTADCLRKAYPVAPYIVAGFAGSVRIGFYLLDSVAHFLAIPEDAPHGACWDPKEVAEHWAPVARDVFNAAPESEQRLGAQFLLAGPHPAENGMLDRAVPYLCKLSWPSFEPSIVRNGNSTLSIGSGSIVPEYASALADVVKPDSGLLQFEMGPNPGGWANMLGFAVNRIAAMHEVAGVSPHVHINVALRGGFHVQTSDMTQHLPDGTVIEHRMPKVAENYPQFVALANDLLTEAAGATC